LGGPQSRPSILGGDILSLLWLSSSGFNNIVYFFVIKTIMSLPIILIILLIVLVILLLVLGLVYEWPIIMDIAEIIGDVFDGDFFD